MLKLYITVRDINEDKGVTLFEDLNINYLDKEYLLSDLSLPEKIYSKIEEVEKINEQVTQPF